MLTKLLVNQSTNSQFFHTTAVCGIFHYTKMTRSLLIALASLWVLQAINAETPPQYMGCFGDSAERAMNSHGYHSNPDMTIQLCVDRCSHEGYAFAGLEVGSECFCDNDYTRWGQLPQSKCSNGCRADSSEVRRICLLSIEANGRI